MPRPVLAILLAGLALVGLALVVPIHGVSAQDQAQSQPPSQAPSQSPSQAQTAPPANEGGRYTFHRMGEGFVRLDSTTGQVAECKSSATGWSCHAAPDERLALESEIARLQRENASLKKSMLSRGLDLPGGATTAETRPVPPASIPDTSDSVPRPPSEAEIDRAIAYMKNVWKKLVDMMIDLQRDIQRKS
jgi:hypothetical protein